MKNQFHTFKGHLGFKYSIIFMLVTGLFPSSVVLAETLVDDSLSMQGVGGVTQEYLIPDAFQMALKQGLSVPIYLKVKNTNVVIDDVSKLDKFAEATVVLRDDRLYIDNINYHLSNKAAKLSAKSEEALKKANGQFFDSSELLQLSTDIALKIDIERFVLTMEVDERGFEPVMKERVNVLPLSTVDKVSSILNYDLGIFNVKENQNSSNLTSSYLNYQLISAYKENNITLNGSLYDALSAEKQDAVLREVMFKRDVDGKEFKMGMADSWNFQSIGRMSALNAKKIYGIGLTNNSKTNIYRSEQSLTPVIAFLPEPGDVLVYRDGKLLSSQSYAIGTYEIDTSRYPVGIYNVEVQVVINGRVKSTHTQRINKPFVTNGLSSRKWYWDLYAGYVKDRQVNRKSLQNTNQYMHDYEDTYIAGFSLSKRFDVLSGLDVATSNYVIGDNFYNENSLNLQVLDYGSIDWTVLLSGAGSYRNSVNFNVVLPRNIGNAWVGYEKSSFKEDLSIGDSDNVVYGTSLNLNAILPFDANLGSVYINRSHDFAGQNSNMNLSYGTNLYTNRFGTVSVQAGLQQYQDNLSGRKDRNKYISFNLSMPLGRYISTGLASYNGDLNLIMNARKTFDTGFIRSAGLGLSKGLSSSDNSNDKSGLGVNAYTTFEAKYASGTANLARSASGRLTGNLMLQGSMGIAGGAVVASGQKNNSGIIIESNLNNNAIGSAKINGIQYSLTGKRNFIPLEPYKTYQVELMNNKNSKETLSILSGREFAMTLYPGNIAKHKPEIKQMITVFGRLVDDNGEAMAGRVIKNHIGQTVTDEAGSFALDVDAQYPSINLMSDTDIVMKQELMNSGCEMSIDFSKSRGVLWLGDVSCHLLTQENTPSGYAQHSISLNSSLNNH